MEVVQTKEVPDKATLLKHRGDGLGFRDLFLGSISILPDLDIEEGELCYHPEGVKYGPQDDGPEERAVLVLQFGGASKQGYLAHAQLKLGEQSLRKKGGRFEQGKYYGPDADPSIPVDGFKAIWEECMGQKMTFPEGRYGSVVNMKPKAYTYVQDKSNEAISRKKLGVFSERETRAEVVKLVNGGSWDIPSEDASRFYWVLSGLGSVDGQELKAESAGRLKPGLSATVVCEGADLEILCFALPTLVKIQ
ncbi:hypothetical protein N7493_006447 [Penicillium malachiteum]|uniref:Uncharacterized protein n=1 Tax=Penicillium malachiteum TaxID=1324776 RepID=A0AAD6HL25_9EURO|nr:hypothetical protein N7493_006447 [Penicillium malachiteum]